MRVKDALGAYGERLAARFLIAAGFEIVDRNWRCAAGELDIVARDGVDLVVIEVKTRSSSAFGDPAEAVVGPKAERLRRLGEHWRDAHPGGWGELRVDVVSVVRGRTGGPAQVDHHRAVA